MLINELEINSKIKDGLKDMGFEELMPIQEQTLALILDGSNVIGEAETGTGKTAAFLIPILNQLDLQSKDVQCMIAVPTRELAIQIVREIEKIGKYLHVRYATLVGGMSIQDQLRSLSQKPNIVVGTLGRINDHLRNKKLDLSHTKYFVLDEADEMLKEGFKEDIMFLHKFMPKEKQTLLFSATFSPSVLTLAKELMSTYQHISVKSKNKQSVNIEQFYIVMKEKQKLSVLIRLLEVDKPESAIIFGRTKRRADELSKALVQCGYKAAGIHGDLTQSQRNAVMKSFRNGQVNILVATDVAARGIDIDGISHVYNFDLPEDIEFYVHRIGRTGRANRKGKSYSFLRESELPHIERIQKETNVKMTETSIPSSGELWDAMNEKIEIKIQNILSEIDITRNNDFKDHLIERFGEDKLVSVLIYQLSEFHKMNDISLTGEPPVKTRIKAKRIRNYPSKGHSNYSSRNQGRNQERSQGRDSGRSQGRNPNRDRNRNHQS